MDDASRKTATDGMKFPYACSSIDSQNILVSWHFNWRLGTSKHFFANIGNFSMRTHFRIKRYWFSHTSERCLTFDLNWWSMHRYFVRLIIVIKMKTTDHHIELSFSQRTNNVVCPSVVLLLSSHTHRHTLSISIQCAATVKRFFLPSFMCIIKQENVRKRAKEW